MAKACQMVPARPAFSISSRTMASASRSVRSEEHTSELQSREKLVCRLLLDTKRPGCSVIIPPARTRKAVLASFGTQKTSKTGSFFSDSINHSLLHSFPTRRSSDLVVTPASGAANRQEDGEGLPDGAREARLLDLFADDGVGLAQR